MAFLEKLRSFGVSETKIRERFAQHLGQSPAKPEEIEILENLPDPTNKVDNYASEIINISVFLDTDSTENNGTKKDANFVVKTFLGSFFLGKEKMTQLFAKEVLWYEVLSPSLTKIYPEMKELSPNCLYSFSNNYEEKIGTPFLQRILGKFYGRIFNKAEKGIILLENMSIESSTISSRDLMKGRNKHQIMGVDEAKGAMVAMGTFHGVMWNFYKGHCLPTLENRDQNLTISREDIISYIDPSSLQFGEPSQKNQKFKEWHSWMAKTTFKAVKLMIENFFPDQKHLCSKMDHYASTRHQSDINQLLDRTKMYYGIGHCDLDGRNILVNQGGNKVMLIDYQTFAPVHLSQDFWHLVYSCTDQNFRELYLDTCFETYFETLKKYIGDYMPNMTLNGLKEEVQEMRLIKALVWAPSYFALMLNPELPPQDNLFSGFNEKLDELGRANFKPEDEKMMDLRRRVLDVITEASKLDLI